MSPFISGGTPDAAYVVCGAGISKSEFGKGGHTVTGLAGWEHEASVGRAQAKAAATIQAFYRRRIRRPGQLAEDKQALAKLDRDIAAIRADLAEKSAQRNRAAVGDPNATDGGDLRPSTRDQRLEAMVDTIEQKRGKGLLSRFCATIREIRDFNREI
eukprot:SAG31_NODE_21130_length_557_cov_0.899563_1_plen_156_part_01